MAKQDRTGIGSALVQRQWQNRVAAEYASSAIASQLLHWLIQIGASPDLLFQCQEVVREELTHTELARDVYLAAGGEDKGIMIHPHQLTIPHAPQSDLLTRALEFTADFFCCGETVAAPLFQAMVAKSQNTVARKSLLRIVRDEKDHGDFGWELLEHLLTLGTRDHRENLKQRVPDFIQRIVTTYSTQATVSAADEGWGVISGEEHAAIARQTAEKVLRPNFKTLLGA